MKSKVTTAPASEPISLSELKLSLRITDTAQDTILTQYITDARDMAERYTGRKFMEQTLTSYADLCSQMGEFQPGWRVGHINELLTGGGAIVFDWSPAISISSVVTIDPSNSETAYSSANYYLDNFDDDKLAKMVFNDSASLPPALRNQNAWKIVWKAGYGTASTSVPASIRRAITMLAGYLYAHRGDYMGDYVNRGDYAGDAVERSDAAKFLNPFVVIRG